MKILYVTTISNTVNAFLIPHIRMLINEGHKVDVAFNIEQDVKQEIYELGCKVHHLPFKRSPLKKDNLNAFKLLENIISTEEYDLVHTHTPIASAIVRLVCKNLIYPKVFYTAHGFHFYKGAPLINWIVYYPVEKWLSKYTDTIITINEEDFKRAKCKFNSKKIDFVHGVGLNIIKNNIQSKDKDKLRIELNLSKENFVILSVGELNKNKNHEVIIRTIAKLNDSNYHYLICGQGKLESYLRKLSADLGVENQVHLLGYRKDIPEICRVSDIFAFPSFREGLSVALMEAMSNELPIVCSRIRGNIDLIEEGKGGFLCNPDDSQSFANAINILKSDIKLRKNIVENNLVTIKKYELNNVLEYLSDIYMITDAN